MYCVPCYTLVVVLAAAFARTKDPSEIIGADVVDEEVRGCMRYISTALLCLVSNKHSNTVLKTRSVMKQLV
jgi:hypothetical protein